MLPKPRSAPLASATAIALLTLSLQPAHASGPFFQQNSGATNLFTGTTKARPLKQAPMTQVITPVPEDLDPSARETVTVRCFLAVANGDEPVKKARGSYESHLYVLDSTSGRFDVFEVNSGKFKTDSEGIVRFDFDVSTELFADGFESGDVSAWVSTRTAFTKKKATFARALCDIFAAS